MLFEKSSIQVDAYVFDVLMRDILGHDQQPSALVVYLFLYAGAARRGWRPVSASLRHIADATGISKSAVQSALQNLHRRELVLTTRTRPTASPWHRVRRPWRRRWKRGERPA
jgi:DNA-binding transcriptional MocR family regulator